MRKFTFLLIAALVFSLATAVLAQDATGTTTITITANTATITGTLPDVVVSCPPEAVSIPVLRNAELVFGFDELNDVLVVPMATAVEETSGITLEVTATVLTCSSTPDEVLIIDRSLGIRSDEPAPNPENLPGLAEALDGYAVVNIHAANLRSCASPTCTRVAVVDGGEYLIVLGRNTNLSWWYVQAGEYRGWIWDDLVLLRGDLTEVPFVKTEGEPEPPLFYVGFPGNPLYSDLTEDGHIICGVQGDTFYPLVGRTSNDAFFLIDAICTDGSEARGWMNAETGLVRNLGRVAVPVYRGLPGEGMEVSIEPTPTP